ncbi:hypothetical protein ABPG74_005851 [Tetrahymena malaccensis]
MIYIKYSPRQFQKTENKSNQNQICENETNLKSQINNIKFLKEFMHENQDDSQDKNIIFFQDLKSKKCQKQQIQFEDSFKDTFKSTFDLLSYVPSLDIGQIIQSDSYVISKLSIQFEQNRFKRQAQGYRNLVQQFYEDYYPTFQESIFSQRRFDEQFRLVFFKFENDSIVYTMFYNKVSQKFINAYLLIKKIEFGRFYQSYERLSKIQLIESIFCKIINFNEEYSSVIEEAFDLSFKQLLEYSKNKFNQIDRLHILMQLIDFALIFDELGLFYSQYDEHNVGLDCKESKYIIKLRKLYTLKKCQNSFDKQIILYREISCILELVRKIETNQNEENNFYDKLMKEFIEDQHFQSRGVCQKEVIEFFEKYYEDVLMHYPIINMHYLQIYIQDGKLKYQENNTESDNQEQQVQFYHNITIKVSQKQQKLESEAYKLLIWLKYSNETNFKSNNKCFHDETIFSQIRNFLLPTCHMLLMIFLFVGDLSALQNLFQQINKLQQKFHDTNFPSYFQIKECQRFYLFIQIILNRYQNNQVFPLSDQMNNYFRRLVLSEINNLNEIFYKLKLLQAKSDLAILENQNSCRIFNYFNLYDQKQQISDQFIQEEIKFSRDIQIQNQQQKQEFQQAVKNLSKLLYIDFTPILHQYGLTKQTITYPVDSDFSFNVENQNSNILQLRLIYELQQEKQISQYQIQDTFNRTKSLIKKLNDLSKTTNNHFQFKQSLKADSNGDIYVKNFCKINTQDCLIQLVDRKFNMKYCIISIPSTQHFYMINQRVLSVNSDSNLTRFVSKIGQIDYEYQHIYIIDGKYNLDDLKYVYVRNNTYIQEITLRQILNQMLQILFYFLENNYYLTNLKLNSFSLYKSYALQNNFYLKYNQVYSITQTLNFWAYMMAFNGTFPTSLQKLENQKNQQSIFFEFTEEHYLFFSIKLFIHEVLKLVFNLDSQVNQIEDQESFQLENNQIEKLKKIFSKELSDFILFFLEKNKLQIDKDILYCQIRKIIPEQQVHEDPQFIYLSQTEQVIIKNYYSNSNQLNELALLYYQHSNQPEELVIESLKTNTFCQIMRGVKQIIQNNIQISDESIELILKFFFDIFKDKQNKLDEQIKPIANENLLSNPRYCFLRFTFFLLNNQKHELFWKFYQNQVESQPEKEFFSNILRLAQKSKELFQYQIDINTLQYLQNNLIQFKHNSDIAFLIIRSLIEPAYLNIDNLTKLTYKPNLFESEDQGNYFLQDLFTDSYIQILDKLQKGTMFKRISQDPAFFQNQQLITQQLYCICAINLNKYSKEDVKVQLQILENLYKNKIKLEKKNPDDVKIPQIILKEMALNISEYYLNTNPEQVQYYSRIHLRQNKNYIQLFDDITLKQKIKEAAQVQRQQTFNSFPQLDRNNQIDQQNCQKLFVEFLRKYKNLENEIMQVNYQLNIQITNQNVDNIQNLDKLQQQTECDKLISNNQNSKCQLDTDYYFETQEYQPLQEEPIQCTQTVQILNNKSKSNLFENTQAYLQNSKIVYQESKSTTFFQEQNLNEIQKTTKIFNIQSEIFQQDKCDTTIEIVQQQNTQNKITLEIKQKNSKSKISCNQQWSQLFFSSNFSSLQRFSTQMSQLSISQTNISQLSKIGELGEGGQGSVQIYYDFQQKKRYALKHFKQHGQYLNEKCFHQKILQQKNNVYLSSYVCKLLDYSDNENKLLFETGILSLHNLKQLRTIQTSELIDILKSLIQFNIQMNERSLYHGDITPFNVVIFQDQNEQKAQKMFGFFASESIIQIKVIDFVTYSNTCSHYYMYRTNQFKYLEYIKTSLDWNKILFAETYSVCKTIYSLMQKDLQQQVDQFNLDIEKVISINEETSQLNKLIIFLNMFILENKIKALLSQDGITIGLLTYFFNRIFGKLSCKNKNIKLENLNLLKNHQWQNITDIKSMHQTDDIECQIMKAFYYKNNLKDYFSLNNSDSLQIKIEKIDNFLDQILILPVYESFDKYFLANIFDILQNYHQLADESLDQFIQLACFLYSHKPVDDSFYGLIIDKIIEYYNNSPRQYSEFVRFIIRIFKYIKFETDLNDYSEYIIENLGKLINNQEINFYTFVYEFFLGVIFDNSEVFRKFSKQIFSLLDSLLQKPNLNNFQKQIFLQYQIQFHHIYLNHEHQLFCSLFLEYQELIRNLETQLDYGTILLYNWHQSFVQNIEDKKFENCINTDQSLSNSCKRIQQHLQNIEKSLMHQQINQEKDDQRI